MPTFSWKRIVRWHLYGILLGTTVGALIGLADYRPPDTPYWTNVGVMTAFALLLLVVSTPFSLLLLATWERACDRYPALAKSTSFQIFGLTCLSALLTVIAGLVVGRFTAPADNLLAQVTALASDSAWLSLTFVFFAAWAILPRLVIRKLHCLRAS